MLMYTVSGVYHRLGGPAWIDLSHRRIRWYEYGSKHRIYGPAVITNWPHRGEVNLYYRRGEMHVNI